jgi:hypothetical protein
MIQGQSDQKHNGLQDNLLITGHDAAQRPARPVRVCVASNQYRPMDAKFPTISRYSHHRQRHRGLIPMIPPGARGFS